MFGWLLELLNVQICLQEVHVNFMNPSAIVHQPAVSKIHILSAREEVSDYNCSALPHMHTVGELMFAGSHQKAV